MSNLNPEVIEAIINLVTRRLQNAAGYSSPQVQPQPQQNRASPPPAAFLDALNVDGLLDTPQPAENSVRRSSSVSSSSSAEGIQADESQLQDSQLQDSSQVNDDDDDDDEQVDPYDAIKPRRGGKSLYLPSDKQIVNRPIMELLDSLFLAPIASNLFCRKRRKDSSAFKKNADIRFNMFKCMIKPTIRRLVSESEVREPNLTQRFFWCAYDLVRKRRANHIQSWRTHARPLKLIYGGQDEYNATFQSSVPRIPVTEIPVAAAAYANSETQVASPPKKRSKKLSPQKPSKNKKPSPPRVSDKNKKQLFGAEQDAEVDPFAEDFCEDLEHTTYKCVKCGDKVDWNSYCTGSEKKQRDAHCKKCRLFKCFGCGKQFPNNESYPRGASEWGNEANTTSNNTCLP